MFPSFHELLVNDLASIVFAGLDVYGLLNDGICPTAKCPPSTILGDAKLSRSSDGRRTWQGTVVKFGIG